MKKINIILSLLTTIFLTEVSNAQLCVGNDTTVCVGSSLSIIDCNPGTGGAGNLPSPTYVTLWDDVFSAAVPIGFTFNIYGNNYTQCVIGSNGLVSFNLSNAGGYCPWSLTSVGTLPTTSFSAAFNSAMPAYHDINPGVGGTVYYETIGTAPNRQFVVVWDNIPAFGASNYCSNMALVLNETSNIVEAFVGFKPIYSGWNGGLAIQGLENNGGTIAHITPGRNNSQWAATNDARRWTPTAPNNTSAYTITQIPYIFYDGGGSNGSQWGNTLGQTFPYNNGVLNITSVQSGTVGYFVSTNQGAACSNNPSSAVSDTSWVTGVSSSVSASGTDDICSAGMGTVTATPTGGQPNFTYYWPGLGGATTQTVTGVFAGTYTVEMTDGMGCMSTATVTIGDTPANYSSSSTLVSCPGGNDGTAFAEMVPPIGNISYQWDDPAMQTTQTAVGLTAGTYNCTITSDVGCSNVVTVTVSEIPGMIANIVNQSDVTCNSGNDGIINLQVTQGTAPYTYSWDNSSSTDSIATDLPAGTSTCTITDANGCVITISGTLNEPPALDITFITPNTQICPEDDIDLNVQGTGGSSAYTFTWYQNGNIIGVGNTINVDPLVTNTEYCVVLSEACGSPTDEECTLIYFPTPIEPNAQPFDEKMCVPSVFEFYNTSTNAGEIATTYWEFNIGGETAMEIGDDTTSMYYDIVGTYDITMTVTSIYGCVYTATLEDLITVLPSPTALFNFSSNPTTIFETTVTAQNGSSPNVVEWNWVSPYSSPSGSNVENPIFVFPDGETGIYPVTLYVTTNEGCTDSITLELQVVDDILVFAPTAFTPDGDEHNQYWKPYVMGIDYFDYDLYVFNRWGEIVWESHDESVGWDGTYHGKPVQAGTYQWKMQVKNPFNDDKETYTGSFSVLR